MTMNRPAHHVQPNKLKFDARKSRFAPSRPTRRSIIRPLRNLSSTTPSSAAAPSIVPRKTTKECDLKGGAVSSEENDTAWKWEAQGSRPKKKLEVSQHGAFNTFRSSSGPGPSHHFIKMGVHFASHVANLLNVFWKSICRIFHSKGFDFFPLLNHSARHISILKSI